MQQQSRTPPLFYANARNRTVGVRRYQAGCLRHWFTWRLALMLIGVLILCGFAAGIAFLFQRPPSVGSRSGTGYKVVAIPIPSADIANGLQRTGDNSSPQYEHRQRDVTREYLASNLSVLLSGTWTSKARFHPTAFLSETDVLNRTVHCDTPSLRDTSLVYSEPTWYIRTVKLEALVLALS